MRERLIIKLDGKLINGGKPVKLTDTEFKKLRSELLKRKYSLDADKDWNLLEVSGDRIPESTLLIFPATLVYIFNKIRSARPQIQRRKTL